MLMNGCALLANKNKIEENILIKLPQIVLEDRKVDSLVNVIIKQNQEYLKRDCFILIGITNGNKHNSTEVIITLYEKKKFKLACPKNDYPIVGYAEISLQTVLFIGKIYNTKMRVKEDKKEFTFSCRKEGKNYPPSMYNPTIHRFILKNDGIIESTFEK